MDGLSKWKVAGKELKAGEGPTLDSVATVQSLPSLGVDGVVGLHTIKLVVRNTVSGLESEQTVQIRVIKQNKPTMSIVGGPLQSFVIGRPKSILLDVQLLDLSLCPGATSESDGEASTTRLDFIWILNGQRLDTVFSIAPWGRVVEMGRKFVANTAMMPQCNNSVLSVTVVQSSAVVTINGTATVKLQPQLDELVAVIESSRSTAGSDNVVKLSAMASYDVSGAQTHRDMVFKWICVAMQKDNSDVLEPGCRTIDGTDVRLGDDTAPIVMFTPQKLKLKPGFTYTFAVNVSAPPPMPCHVERSAMSSVSLKVVEGSKVPALAVSVCATCECNCAEPPPRYFNPGQSVCLTTKCSGTKVSDRITSHKWSIDKYTTVKSGLQESLIRVVMGVPPAVDTAFAYKFNVLVGYQSGAQLVGTVSVLPNYPPAGGSISVSPKNGVAMTDDFLVSAVGWRDDNMPLHFEFVAEDRVVKRTCTLHSGSESAINCLLPFFEHPGKSDPNKHTLLITGKVRDNIGSSTEACSTKFTPACPRVSVGRKQHVAPHAEAEELTNLLSRQLLTPLQATMRAISSVEGLSQATSGIADAQKQEKSRLQVCIHDMIRFYYSVTFRYDSGQILSTDTCVFCGCIHILKYHSMRSCWMRCETWRLHLQANQV